MFFPKLILTNAGRALIVKALNGTTLNFTKFALGDGAAPEEPRKLEALVHLVANMQINSIELSANCAVLESTYTNSGLKSKLVAREIGIFAADPDDGEILYAYANAGNEAAVVPPESEGATVQETFHMVVTVGDAATVTATLGEYSGYASKVDLQNHVEDENNPHKVTAEQIGLGNVPNVSPANQQPVFPNDYIMKSDGSYDVQNIDSGEKLGSVLRKIRTAIAAFTAHLSAKNPHNISSADISAAAKDHKHSANDVTIGIFPISRGGTGAATATEAREKLGVAAKEHKHSASDIEGGTIPVANGGTGATDAKSACTNIGAMPKSGGTFTGRVNFGGTSSYIDATGIAVFSKAYGAVWNDYAEFFPRGEDTKPGDVIALNMDGDEESYIRATNLSRRVVGVHSDEYAYLIGGEHVGSDEDYVQKNITKYIPVALAGRVLTRVKGPVSKGDTILPSDEPGVGRAALACENPTPELIVGYAVESDNRTDVRRLRVRVKGW